MDHHDLSLVDLGLALACAACEAEVEQLDDAPDTVLCRHCGTTFWLDLVQEDRQAS